MKHILLLISIILFSQIVSSQKNNDTYETLWEQVKTLEKDALTKSANNLVASISEKAKEEKNSPQIIKALLHTSKYAMTLEEDAQLKIINDFKKEIVFAEFPTKNILESYLATLYWQYFQQNRYKFYNRTKTEAKVDSVDFRTWDLTTLFKEISIHFEASLENENSLKKTPVSKFNSILNQQKDTKEYRPTLFDLLAHNALAFYKTNENSITRPADKFEINNPNLLCDGFTFINTTIATEDKTALQAKALHIYQQLVVLHSTSKKPYTYAELDIERLTFIYENATFENKTQQFLEVLNNAVTKQKNTLAAGLYQYQIALLLKEQGSNYSYQAKVEDDNHWKIKKALAICESVIIALPKSSGAEKCTVLKSQILQKSLELTTEKYIPTNTTSRLLVRYKNLDGLSLTAFQVTHDELDKLYNLYSQNKKLAFIKKLSIVKKWKANLKNESDYQSHSTEIELPPLKNGQYVILAETNNKTFSYNAIQVTNMAVIESRTNREYSYQLIDRLNGNPLSGVKLKFTYIKNYSKTYFAETYVSDKMGLVKIPLSDDYWSNVRIWINNGNEKANFGTYRINKKFNQNEKEANYSCFLFTDRSIYRPGQPLYFKGIAIKNDNGVSSILEKQKVTVQLKDVNGQVVTTEKFITNDYGSFSGEFILPSNGLTGQFSLKVTSEENKLRGNSNFSVEEYKRPKFETSFEPSTETYKVNDNVTVKGTAKAYAGSTITDAKVSYRVKRVVYYPRWYYRYYPSHKRTPQEIAHGETTADASGAYEIDFKAVPDTSVDKKNLPTFNYEVTADVTDINGETHSAITIITVGYHTMTASMSIANPFDKDSKENKLSIATNNLNGQFVPTKGTIKMYKLKAPEGINRPRKWTAPDYPGWSEDEFKSKYPHDAYNNEHDASTWEKGELVWQTNFDTEKSKELSFENTKKWPSGKYVLEIESKDKFGQPVKDIIQTTLFSQNDNTLSDNQLFEIKTDKETYAIGDKVKVTLLSNSKDINITVHIEKGHKIIETKLIHLNNNSQSFTVPVTADDLGGFAITYSFSAYNHFEASTITIQVPYPSSQLEIETLTFRDKLQPGTDETWSFKIKGPKGDKVVAELLANMYDASLDSFRSHSWDFNPLIKPTYYSNSRANDRNSFSIDRFQTYLDNQFYKSNSLSFSSFDLFGLRFGRNYYEKNRRGNQMLMKSAAPMAMMADADMELEESVSESLSDNDDRVELDKNSLSPTPSDTQTNAEENTDGAQVQIRKNLQETAFFFPQLKTDKEGNVTFNFTTPEALTKWNVQLLAHNKKLESSYTSLQTVTQKELMVLPNAPRFLREGDEIIISSKIANLTENALSGNAKLKLVDVITGKDISKELISSPPSGELEGAVAFKVDSIGNTLVSWRIKIPEGIQAVQYTITAKAGNFSDGEQNVLPVLTNRMLVTETLPMWVHSNQTKAFTLDKLKTTQSTTLKHHKLTLEITSNPAWYAVQALPYLMEYPYECNEQTFSKYYANTLASHIANSNPRIQDVFKQWANSDALVSNLEKNQELKLLLIQETPWLRDAQSETEQKKRIALLFNLNKMQNEQSTALNKLKQNQENSGAWPWFNGGPDSRFVTQHIIAGMGHLKHLTSATLSNQTSAALSNPASEAERSRSPMIKKAVTYLDNQFVKEYKNMKKYANDINDDHLSQTQIHYLYMRSFFKDIKASKQIDEITSYYKTQTQKYWQNKGLYAQGMLALIMHRSDDTKTSEKILRALEENSITSEELGMYWKKNTNSWHWYQAPIETQALLIEAFSEIHPKDVETIDNLKIWLLKNKQTNQWKTTKATTEAVYALLLQGSDWLSVTDAVDVLVGGEKIAPSKLENVKVEAGTGYYKTAWNTAEIKPKMAEVQISKKGDGIVWGAMYWQYFEDLDKITAAETPLKLKKKLFLKKNTDTGEEISEITAKTDLKVGNLVKVRIELRVDRPMEFVHIKDMRAAGFEPVNVISRYKWQDGLGYYEATKDASTNFFFDYLPKGVYVFEYDVRVNNAGNFSNGITTIQSMYAPEFSSHSEGIRVEVNGE